MNEKKINIKLLNSYVKAMGEDPRGFSTTAKLKIVEPLLSSKRRTIHLVERGLVEAIVLARQHKAARLKKKRAKLQRKR